MKDINEILRNGNILIKYILCPNNTKHVFCVEYKNKYYEFIMKKGVAVNINDREIKEVKGNNKKGKYFDIYKESSLNLIKG